VKPNLQPVIGINQTGAVFPHTSQPQSLQPNLTLRAATPGHTGFCDLFDTIVIELANAL